MTYLKGLFFLILVSLQVDASTHHLQGGQVFVGKEYENDRPTGQICYISVLTAMPLASKGLHCHKVVFQFNSNRSDIPRQNFAVISRITNYHRPEYPEIKTCAMNVDGTSSGDEIYATDTDLLFNHIFSGAAKFDGTDLDYFLSIDRRSKSLSRARIQFTSTFRRYHVDCLELEEM